MQLKRTIAEWRQMNPVNIAQRQGRDTLKGVLVDAKHDLMEMAAWLDNREYLVRELEALVRKYEDAAPPAAPDVSELAGALESLIKAYVRLLEAGRERIIALGGQCDSVDFMERIDPNLRDARAALSAHQEQQGPSQ